MNATFQDTTCNGWRNYNTWLVNLWITNDSSVHAGWLEQTRECLKEAANSGVTWVGAKFALSERLKIHYTETERPGPSDGMYEGLLDSALDDVEWYDIAAGFIGEVQCQRKQRKAKKRKTKVS